MARISYVNTGVKQERDTNFNIPTDESIGIMVFDINGYSNPFEKYPLLYDNFKDNKVQLISNMDEALLLGIQNDGFLNGLLYHHLSWYYDFIGDNKNIYIAFIDSSEGWDSLQNIHHQISGKEFFIGLWTALPLWKMKEDGSIGFTSLITDLQAQANEINGTIGHSSISTTPISIILNGNTAYMEGGEIDYKEIPDAKELECPKISVVIAQEGSSENHIIQNNNPNHAPVGSLGYVMACLSLCGAEESIASIEKCDLNKNEGFNNPEWCVGLNGISIGNVNQVWTNIISSRGYIVPVAYEEIEASCFFSSDQTLSNGDYGSIANNRIIHKCRRAMCTALMPHVNDNHLFSVETNSISSNSKDTISNDIYTLLDVVMKNKMGQRQIDERSITFGENDDTLDTDMISIKLEVKPVNYNGTLTEEVSHNVE